MREQEAHDLAELVEASLPYSATVHRRPQVSREEHRFGLRLWEGRPYFTRVIRVFWRLAPAVDYVGHLLTSEERREAYREYGRMAQ